MTGPLPRQITLSQRQENILKRLARKGKCFQQIFIRIQIILLAAMGMNNTHIANKLEVSRNTVRLWRERWHASQHHLSAVEKAEPSDKELGSHIGVVLSDRPRTGRPCKFSQEQFVRIVAIACEDPALSERPISHWTARELADEAVLRNIVPSISVRTVQRLLDDVDLKPHRVKYWLNARPKDLELFSNEVQKVCDLYAQALNLYEQGVKLMSVDEKTGIQALERLSMTLPVKPGLVERQEHSYIRNGTLCLTPNFEVATGQIIAPTIGKTRNERDFVQHIEQTVATASDSPWIFICDQLNTHKSEGLVLYIAKACGITEELGVKGKSGILKSMDTRSTFLEDETHRIRFVYTPKHTSWLNQIEIWFSILTRKLLKRGNFTSVMDLEQQLQAFIDYFNATMAKPFRWTYTGRPLVAA